MMKLCEALEPGRRYKVGAREAFIWCGTYDEEFETALRDADRIELERAENGLVRDKRYIHNSTTKPIQAIRYRMIFGRPYVRDHIPYEQAAADVKERIAKARKRCKMYRKRIESHTPIMEREVKEMYTSAVDSDVTIVLVTGGERGEYWDEEECRRGHEGGNHER